MSLGREVGTPGYAPARRVMAELRAAEKRQRIAVEWSDVYVRVFTCVILLAVVVSAVASAGYQPACLVGGCQVPNPSSLALVYGGVAVATLLLGRLLGPHVATPAHVSLLHRAPLSRAVLLARSRGRLYAWAAIGSFGIGSALLMTERWPAFVALGVLASCLSGLTLSERLQVDGGRRAFTRGDLPFFGTILVALGLLVGPWPPVQPPSVVGWLSSLLMAAGGVALAWRFGPQLDRIRTDTLLRADDLRTSLGGASVSFDLRLIADILMSRTHRPISGPELILRATGPVALAWMEALRIVRRETPLVVGGNLLIGGGAILPLLRPDGIVVGAPLAMLGFAACLTGLRRLLISKGLNRMFPMRPVTMRLSLSVVGACSATVWSICAGLAVLVTDTASPAMVAIVALWVALAAAVRWCGVLAPDYSTGLIVTELGVMPAGALLSSLRGWDVLVVGVSTLVIGGLNPVGLVVCLLCVLYGFLRG